MTNVESYGNAIMYVECTDIVVSVLPCTVKNSMFCDLKKTPCTSWKSQPCIMLHLNPFRTRSIRWVLFGDLCRKLKQ